MRVTIQRDAGVGTIADTLDQAGVIGNATLFELRARLSGSSNSLKPGVYYLRKDSPTATCSTSSSRAPATS